MAHFMPEERMVVARSNNAVTVVSFKGADEGKPQCASI